MSLNLDRSTWKRVKLGDVVLRSRAQADPFKGDVGRYVAGGHIDTDSVIISRSGDVADGQMGSTFHYFFKPGQVLFVSARPYLRKTGIPDFAGVVADKTYVLEAVPGNGLLHDMLPFLLTSDRFVEYATQEATGSMNPRLLWSAMQRYEFDQPPLDEQKRIAELLWALERHQLTLTLCHDALSKSATELRRGVLEARSWDGHLGEALRGITAGRSLAATSVPATADTFGVLKVSAVGGNGFVGSENKQLLDQSGFLPQFTIRKGDLLITRANTAAYVGRPAIVDADYPHLMLSDKTLRLEIEPSVASAQFLQECLLAPRTRTAIAEVATGTGAAMKNITQAEIRALPMPRFSLHEQKKFLHAVARVSEAMNRVTEEHVALSTLKSGLLSGIFGDN